MLETKTQSGWCLRSPEPDESFLAAVRQSKQLSESESLLDMELELMSLLGFLFLFFWLFLRFLRFMTLLWTWGGRGFLSFLILRDFNGTSDQFLSNSCGGQSLSKFGQDEWVWITRLTWPVRKNLWEKNEILNYKLLNQKKYLKIKLKNLKSQYGKVCRW